MSAPILAYPQFHGAPFILDTDFSVDPGAIGGVLSQVQDGQERVIAYGARRLLPRERSYASTKGELLAVIFFLQYYKYYLLHRPFVLRTDNRALTWIRSLESPTGMILLWLEILASFDFTVQHRKGTLHGNADSLSRAPHASLPTTEEEKVLVSDETAVVAAVQTPPGLTTEEIRDHQERDDHLQDVRRWKETPPSEAEQRLLSPDQRRLLAFLPSLHQDPSSNLWSLQTSEEGTSKERLYVPSALLHRVIEAAHQFLGTCWYHRHRPLLQEAVLPIPANPRGTPGDTAVPRLPSEEPKGAETAGCSPTQCTSRCPFSGLEHGCHGPPAS